MKGQANNKANNIMIYNLFPSVIIVDHLPNNTLYSDGICTVCIIPGKVMLADAVDGLLLATVHV